MAARPATGKGKAASGEAPREGGATRFVTLRVADTLLALPLADTVEIVRRPDIVQIPLAPASLEGLARRQGAVLPVVALRRVLNREDRAPDDASRVVVVNHRGQPVGLSVDRVVGMVTVEGARIDRDAEGTGVDAGLLAGVIRDDRGGAVAAILDTAPVIERQFADLARAAGGPAPARDAVHAGEAAVAEAPSVALVSFAVAGQEFALPIANVERIVPVPDVVSRMPKAPAHLLGVMALPDGLLPLVGLRELFGLTGDRADHDHGRIVVVRLGEGGGVPVGLAVDGVREILRVEPALVTPVPAILAREAEFEDVEAIARLDQGRRLVSVLSPHRMLAHADAVAAALRDDGGGAGMAGAAGGTGRDGRAQGRDEPFVVFRLGEAEYGLPIGAVQEIQRRPDRLSPLPKAPDFVSGLLNLRGRAVPVVDLRRILKLPGIARDDRQRIVVLAVREFRAGLIVDTTSGVLRIPSAAIEPAPTVSEAQRRLIGRVAHLDGQRRLVLLLEVEALFDMEHLAALLESAA